ncbi:N-6 DNA Methylase [Thermomonospora echinospora]|uniref:N-6 DNA Methylase n=1 Tax=Thermomonospora echinospora TaxID=1992 RepID=A0A1H5YR00_9ACTN|nr:N-6 DNA methylase [Thermomonospora echinospora]SEG26025.1 N-6 DNA Methylase [Thermomonospora echinospora]
MATPSVQVTAAEISRIAGVTRATVSNWRRRHDDFPAPVGGTDTRPLYDLHAVRVWLKARGLVATAAPSEELRTALRTYPGGSALGTRLIPLVLAAARIGADELTAKLETLTETDLVTGAQKAVLHLSEAIPGAGTIRYSTEDAEPLRALLHCVRDESAQAALDVLAERELEDSASTGTYGTPQELGDLMARLLQPRTGTYPGRVLDPACGGGTLLAAAARHGASTLAGQDRLLVQAQRSTVRLLLDSPEVDVTIRAGDSLRADAFAGVAVDGVLCNPPYGDRDWGHDELAYDPRWEYGLPPRNESELAWVQHALSHLTPSGYAVMLLPPAVASRSSGRRVRAELLRNGVVRAVIALPPGAATPLHIGLHLWVLQRPDPSATVSDTMLFVDTAEGSDADTGSRSTLEAPRSRREAIDWAELSTATLTPWHAYTEDPAGFAAEPGTARAVPIIDLLDEFVDLTPARRVRAAALPADPVATARQAAELADRLAATVDALSAASAVGTWQAADGRREWRTATVADLTRGGALTLHRAVRSPQDTEVPAEHAERAVLTGHDLATGSRATGKAAELRAGPHIVIEVGDVLLPALLGSHGAVSRVADEEDANCLLGPYVHLLRADPERLDPWFLAGFLAAADNVSRATTGTSSMHLDARRLRVPLLPLKEQRRYGQAFRHLYDLRTAARQAGKAATAATDVLSTGLTAGALLPPDPDSP